MQKPRHSAGSAPLPSAECDVGISTLAKRGGRGAHDKIVHACTTVLDDYNRVSRYSCCLPTFLLLRAQVCGVSKDACWPEQVLLLGVVLRAQGLFYADRNSFGELVVTIIPCIMMIVPTVVSVASFSSPCFCDYILNRLGFAVYPVLLSEQRVVLRLILVGPCR